jgi:hypothetical protein
MRLTNLATIRLFILLLVTAPAEAQYSALPLELLSSEIAQASALSTRLWSAARLVDNEIWLGSMYNEIHVREHTCYSVGMLVGRVDSVRHLRLNRDPPLSASNAEQANNLRLISQSLGNFVGAAKYAISMTTDQRISVWNLDCVGQLGIKGRVVELAGAKIFYGLENNGQVLRVLGDIERGFAVSLRAAVDSNPSVRTVALGSGGGLVQEALEAGRYIRSKGLNTTLWNNCFSACPLVFMGGVERTVWSPYPYLGFHKIYTASGPIPLTSPAYQEVSVYVGQMGASSRFILEMMSSAEPSQMRVIRGTSVLCDQKIATWVQRRC